MAQERFIVPQAVPRLTGSASLDMQAMNRYLVHMVGELMNRLETAEKKLRKLEQANAGNRQ